MIRLFPVFIFPAYIKTEPSRKTKSPRRALTALKTYFTELSEPGRFPCLQVQSCKETGGCGILKIGRSCQIANCRYCKAGILQFFDKLTHETGPKTGKASLLYDRDAFPSYYEYKE